MGLEWTNPDCFVNDMIIFQTDKLTPHYGKRNTSEN